MEAMFYETLIRNVYGTGRTNKNGANADIYRTMDHAFRELTTPMMNTTKDYKEIDFQQTFAAVRGFVRDTIEEGIKKVSYKANPADLTLLNEIKNKLGVRFYDKAELDQMVKDSTDIFFRYDLRQ